VFAAPAAVLTLTSLIVLLTSGVAQLTNATLDMPFGNYWVILAGAMLGVAHTSGLLAAATHLYGVREGYRRPSVRAAKFSRWVSLETMVASGLAAVTCGLIVLLTVIGYWSARGFAAIGSVTPAVLGTTLIVIGAQNALGGFLLAVIGGNEASFLKRPAPRASAAEAPPEPSAAAKIGARPHAPPRRTAA
jgi:hypothetical protein